MITIASPYTDDGTWLRGNLHTHSTASDGTRDVEQVIDDYEARGYDFLAISDHDTFVDPAEYRDRTDMTLLPAVEVSAAGPHLLHVGTTEALSPDENRQDVVDEITSRGELAIANHPNWQRDFDHWCQEQLGGTTGYHGIEIYNGLIETHPGAALATDRWDQLLAGGRQVWGFANDDSHRSGDVGSAWNVVQVDDPSPVAVIESLRTGRFYASTGVAIRDIRISKGEVTVETSNAGRIRLVSDHGIVQQTVEDSTASFRIPDQLIHRHGSDQSYVRIECDGRAGARAWTQPMFLER